MYPQAAAREGEAVDVVRRFFEGINYEYDTDLETKLVGLYRPTCRQCSDAVIGVHSLHVNGQRTHGGHCHVVRVAQIYPLTNEAVEVRVILTQDVISVFSATGEMTTNYPAIPETMLQFFVKFVNDKPIILEYTSLGRV
ncbi:MAG: hypothetical protein IRZ02_06470 [Acidothermus sp.]|nr:hypothetical protein [Acidothermus sp.]